MLSLGCGSGGVRAPWLNRTSACLCCSCPVIRVSEVWLSFPFVLLPTRHSRPCGSLCKEASTEPGGSRCPRASAPGTALPWPARCASSCLAPAGSCHKTAPSGGVCPLETGVMPRAAHCNPVAGLCCDALVEGAGGRQRGDGLASDPCGGVVGPTEPQPAALLLGPGLRSLWLGASTLPARKSCCCRDINIYW